MKAKTIFEYRNLPVIVVFSVIIILLVVLFFVSPSLTGMATGGSGAAAYDTEKPVKPVAVEKKLVGAVGCGSPCWLKNNGQVPAADASTAQGKIGILGADGNCYEIPVYIDGFRCCYDQDCPLDKSVCNRNARSKGTCCHSGDAGCVSS